MGFASDPHIKGAADLAVRLNGVREAIEAIRAELPRALAGGSRIYCDLIRDDYGAHSSRVCEVLVALARAYTDHQDYPTRVKSIGVNTALHRSISNAPDLAT